jgi:hypothetical protein
MASEANFETPCGNADPPRPQPQKPHQTVRESVFRGRRMPAARSIWLVALTAGLLISSQRVLAEDAQHPSVIHLSGAGQSLDTNLVVVCPEGSTTEPKFRDQKTGKIFPISDPRLRAIAVQACRPTLPGRRRAVM